MVAACLGNYTGAGGNPGKSVKAKLNTAVIYGTIVIVSSAAAWLAACHGPVVKPAVSAAPDLGSLTYISRLAASGRVTLVKGEYREPITPGAASGLVVRLTDKTASGTVGGEEFWVAVLATSMGGSGTFYELVLVGRKDGGWINLDTVMLGDRVAVHTVKITGGRVLVEMKTHGLKDPMCCPTVDVTRIYDVLVGRLKPGDGNPYIPRPGS